MAFDVQQIIGTAVGKIQQDPAILSKLLENPGATLEKLTGIDLPDEQINGVVDGIKAQFAGVDLNSLLGEDGKPGLDDLTNLLGKLGK